VAAPAEASLSVIFTPPAQCPQAVSITSPSNLFDVHEHTWRSKHAVAPCGTYVRLQHDGIEIAGAWADVKGFVDFAVPQNSLGPCSLLYCSNQSLDIARGAIHAVSGGENQSQPVATRNEVYVNLAYEGGAGQGEVKSWIVESGRYSGTYKWTHPAGPVVGPCVLLKPGSTSFYVFHDCRTFSGFQLFVRSPGSGKEWSTDYLRPIPHNPTAVTIGGIIYLYYAWPCNGVTRIASEARNLEDGTGIGANTAYICGPPNLSNLVSARSPEGTWLAGEDSGRVYLYRENHLKSSVKGVAPTLASLTVCGQARLLLAYAEPCADETIVWGRLYDSMGTLRGGPYALFTIPDSVVPRISLVLSPAGDAWLFWQGSSLGGSRIFLTKVAFPW
jgi:hypothetical protein